MNKLIIAGLIGLSLSLAVMADSGVYVGIHGGPAIPNDNNLDVGPDVGGQLGYQLGHLRFEGAFSYINNHIKQYDNGIPQGNNALLEMTTLMGNAYYDFNYGGTLTPYVGAGGGWVYFWLSGATSTISSAYDNQFAYQGMAGLRFRASPHFTVDMGYHLLGWTEGNGNLHLVETSLNYVF